jgi:WS/DGAT/MGAT family acyltransferase
MARYAYERLSAQDNGFLVWEKPGLPMHAGALQIFDAGPLQTPEGGIDFERIKRLLESTLHLMVRYRQRIEWIPGERHAVWVDDPHFNLDYHVRHTSLPRPGSEAQLKRLASRLLEQPLDRSRPLWETWIVEGLSDGRFAMINKAHHCMIDGSAGTDLMQQLLSREPRREIRPAPRYIPRTPPTDRELSREARRSRLGLPLEVLRGLRSFAHDTDDVLAELRARGRAMVDSARWYANPAAETPLNGPVGLHRIFETATMALDDFKAVRKAVGCSINDVALATVTGAVRSFMAERQVHPEELDFRVSTPVNVRRADERGRFGNRVSTWIVPLPLGEPDPLRQLEEIRRHTEELKDSRQAAVVDMLMPLMDWIPFDVQALASSATNTFVTNMPGPQFPLYLLGAELLEIFPQPPLLANLGLAIGIMSYNGKVCWGLVGDYDRVPDLDAFASDLYDSFEALARAAGIRSAAGREARA